MQFRDPKSSFSSTAKEPSGLGQVSLPFGPPVKMGREDCTSSGSPSIPERLSLQAQMVHMCVYEVSVEDY